MPPQHSRAGKPHHFADPLAQLRFVAVDLTRGARRLVLPKRTAFQAAHRVCPQFFALGTQLDAGPMTEATIDADHRGDRLLLPQSAWGWSSRLVRNSVPDSCFVRQIGDHRFAEEVKKVVAHFAPLLYTLLCFLGDRVKVECHGQGKHSDGAR